MVDISGMPTPPYQVPDPRQCKDFAEWLHQLTDKSGCNVRQTDVARAALRSPQAVTKWLKGGSIEVETLARLAAWTGAGFDHLRRLVDESKLKTMPAESLEPKRAGGALVSVQSEIAALYRNLTPTHRKQLIRFGHALLATQPKPKK